MSVIGNLITREYKNFRGVDFSNRNDEVNLYRSPDAVNVWKNYHNSNGKCIETRPDVEVLKEFNGVIHGLFFYTYNGEKHKIVHAGTKLYDEDKIIYSDMAESESNFFVYSNSLYIKDSKNYLVYTGNMATKVVGYIPTTTIGKAPNGGGTTYEDVNMLTSYRKNSFVGDGTTREYKLDVESFDEGKTVLAWINGTGTLNFTSNPLRGTITFNQAPPKPDTTGQSNVIIQFSKTIPTYRERIDNCKLIEVFDDRVFFSGNSNYKNMLWHSSLNEPTYVSDLDYYEEGLNDSEVKALISGNNALWVCKEPSQSNTTIFYHNPTIDEDYGKVYPSSHSSISTGCLGKGINFNDDIVFFSNRGMEAISGDVTTEQVLRHRSTLVDNLLLNEIRYKDMKLIEWEGYLLVIVGKNIYLADSRVTFTNVEHNEYEWFYWEFDEDITTATVEEGILYLGLANKLCTLTKENSEIEAYWTTINDEFGYPMYQKTTNKKGCVVDLEGDSITVYAKTDNNKFEKIKEYKNIKGYVVPVIKKKKWKSIQLKFTSKGKFELYSSSLQAYVGAYVKR